MATNLTVPNLEVEELEGTSADAARQEETNPDQDQEQQERVKIKLPDVGDTEEAELARELNAKGVTKAQLQNLVQNTQNYNEFLSALKTNPRGFFGALEQANPEVAKRLLSELTDIYLERHESDESDEGQRRGSRGRGTASQSPEVAQLMGRLDRLEAERAQERSLRDYNSLKDAFNGKIKQYMDSKELDVLNRRDKKAVTALLHQSLANDAEASARIQQGNFRDIPRHLQTVLDDWTTDTLSDAEQEQQDRETVRVNSRRTISAGSDNVGGESARDKSSQTGDPWEDAAQDMARDLRAAKARANRKR